MAKTSIEDPLEVLRVVDASKRFVIRRDNSLKERIVTLGRAGRRHREDFWALRDVDLSVSAGTTVGLIGHNGSGKSTLLKLIGGILDPTSGDVERRGRIAGLIELGAGFHPDLTGRENVYLNSAIMGMSREETEARFPEILAFADIGEFIDTQVKFYSSGMFVRLAFAVAVQTDPDLLLVDEVLAVGDEAFQQKCIDKIKSFQEEGRTIVIVSHSLGQMEDLCDRVVLLDHGRVVYDGDPQIAVGLFREILRGVAPEGLSISAVRDKIERPEFVIGDITLNAAGRDTLGIVRGGDDLIVRATFDSRNGIENWNAGIAIEGLYGQLVYAATSKDWTDPLSPLTEPRTVEFVLHDVHLGAGTYSINIWMVDLDDAHLRDVRHAVQFDVELIHPSVGLIDLELDVRELPVA
jgi:ABC-2 type transport system ATP-binding protein